MIHFIAAMLLAAPPLIIDLPKLPNPPSVELGEEVPAPSLMTLLLVDPPSDSERALLYASMQQCYAYRGATLRTTDPWKLLALLRWAEDLGAPRGLFLATVCVESSQRAKPAVGRQFLGDIRAGVARAYGPFQMHENVWRGTCGGTPDKPHDLLWAAGCYWAEVQRMLRKVERLTTCTEPVRVAEASAANWRRYKFRCESMSEHWKLMVKTGEGK